MQIGYTLSSEEHDPRTLVTNAVRADAEGFDFVSVSDHFHPWVDAQGQSPFVWSTLGAVASSTEWVGIGVGVCCPIMRIHPAIVAHAAATVSALSGGRFFLGVGTGELLNEHVLGQPWPRIETRRGMLLEAVEVIRRLWTGTEVSFDGDHFSVENARLYTLPDGEIPIVMSAFGSEAAEAAAASGCGLWTTAPDEDVVTTYLRGGGRGEIVGQLRLCWADDANQAIDTVHEVWPTAGLQGQLSQELATPGLFEAACATVRREDIDPSLCGPDPQPVLDALAQYEDAGYTKVHLHQVGADQEGFFRFWRDELRPKL